ncbi:triose-phosphate isomerase [Candidatus Aeolococcus gillhamiae]|uniref:Triosephosphate isomerase n=1 Tax=Candidatus Aeolococcus gillhamiae TaxID=3127015 RepID=A0A2W5ZK21_9BACT|nr:MAG: triose-phosphate isomerase [Candidatus Dormibacter sp. RRmetagenome_bin12]
MVAGNWKMNTTIPDGVALARAVLERCGAEGTVDVAVLPPFVHLWPVREVLAASSILLGAQDVFWEEGGAYTGEISPPMLAGWCDLVLVGHSERRHLFGETDAQTAHKFAAARRHGLMVILAVGETETERDEGRTVPVVDRQLEAVLAEIDAPPPADEWVIAYEPVWAIGTGRTASPAQAEEVCAHIRAAVSARAGESPRVLYGGSVTADNAAELFSRAGIDGGLIGGASLKPELFADIVAAAALAALAR